METSLFFEVFTYLNIEAIVQTQHVFCSFWLFSLDCSASFFGKMASINTFVT